MFYKVKAKFNEEKASEFFEKLTNGTVSNQKPDGTEIVASMKRAKITEPGVVEWFEMCFCPTPLKHEKATVYNFYLSDMITEVVEGYGEITGEPFWDYLNSVSKKK